MGMTTHTDPLEGVPAPTAWPTLRARDSRALISFLEQAFGFATTVVIANDDEQGTVAHAELAWPPGGGVMLGSVRDMPDDPWPQQPGAAGCYLVCDDPDALFARAVAAGASVLAPPHDTDYGSREFAVRDPEGNLWSLGTYRGQPRH